MCWTPSPDTVWLSLEKSDSQRTHWSGVIVWYGASGFFVFSVTADDETTSQASGSASGGGLHSFMSLGHSKRQRRVVVLETARKPRSSVCASRVGWTVEWRKIHHLFVRNNFSCHTQTNPTPVYRRRKVYSLQLTIFCSMHLVSRPTLPPIYSKVQHRTKLCPPGRNPTCRQ